MKDTEIDEITECELRKAGLMPTVDTSRVDIEVFVARHLGAHLDLGAALADDVLGVTELRCGEPARIRINRDLTDSAFEIDEYSRTLGRWRATLAHGGTHVLLHGLLFDVDPDQQSMFAEETIADDRLVRCYKRDTLFAGRSRDPREFKTNKGMAALLMPGSVFGEAARDLVAATETAGRSLSSLRDVSKCRVRPPAFDCQLLAFLAAKAPPLPDYSRSANDRGPR